MSVSFSAEVYQTGITNTVKQVVWNQTNVYNMFILPISQRKVIINRGASSQEGNGMNPKLPVAIENFEEIRREGFYYVDKSYLIRDLLNSWGKVNLFTRPRRFGKTLNMSMLKNFFELDADRTLFDGLAIMHETELCEKYMGKFPVVFISLKNVEGENYNHAVDCLKIIIQQEALRLYDRIGESSLLDFEKSSLMNMMCRWIKRLTMATMMRW